MKVSPESFLEDLKYVDVPPHKDEDQVKLDIQRSFTILNHIQSISYSGSSSYATILTTKDIDNLKTKLSHLIIKLLRKYSCLHYYQGFHDIASIILLVCYVPNDKSDDFNNNGEDEANDVLEKLAIFHLRDYMVIDINLSIDHLRLIPMILEMVDDQLFTLIKQTSNSYVHSEGLHYDYKFYQALSSILTIYSHDLSTITQILTIWDFSLSYNSVLINMYIYAATLITFKDRIWEKLHLEQDECNFESVDQDLVHTAVSPSSLFEELTDSDLIKILNKAKELFEAYPVDGLLNKEKTWDIWFGKYNLNSVLCNTSSPSSSKNEKFVKFKKYLTPEKLSEVILKQNDEISQQSLDELQHQQKIFAELQQQKEDELSQSIQSIQYDDESSDNSLSSSLTLASSLTSSSLHRIKSSLLFKKFFNSEQGQSHPDEEKNVVVRNKNWLLSTNTIYRVSVTIGFIGVIMHFILVKYDNLHYSNFLHSLSRSFRSILDHEPVYTLSSIGSIMVNDFEDCFSSVLYYVKNSHFTSGILDQVGIGNLRSTIYGFQQ
ncbi:GYP8 GTPase-activating protein GYP8 [Candida maltosa Xu316]